MIDAERVKYAIPAMMPLLCLLAACHPAADLLCPNPVLRTSPEASATSDFRIGQRDFIAIETREGDQYAYPAIAGCAKAPQRFFQSEAGLNERWPVGGESMRQCRIAESHYISRYNIQMAKGSPENLREKCGAAARYDERYGHAYIP